MPKTYTTKITGYEFSELSEKIQRDWYEKDNECLHYDAEKCFLEPLVEGFQEQLSEDYGATDIEVNYDISYSQGDGCSFTAFFDIDTVLANLDYWQALADDLNSGLIEIEDIRVVRCGPSNYYCHENTCEVVIDWACNPEHEEEEYDRLQELVDDVSNVLTNEIRDKLQDLKRDLYAAFEEATSFEAYQNLMSELDRRYTEDGTMIPHELIKDASIVEGEQLEIPGLFSQMGMEEIELPQLNKISEDETDTLEIEDSLYCRDLSKDRQSYI